MDKPKVRCTFTPEGEMRVRIGMPDGTAYGVTCTPDGDRDAAVKAIEQIVAGELKPEHSIDPEWQVRVLQAVLDIFRSDPKYLNAWRHAFGIKKK